MSASIAFFKKYRYTSVISGVFILILVITVTLFSLGYRMGPGLLIQQAGTLSIPDVRPGATIFIDHEYSGQSATSSTKAMLTPGNHLVIVSTDEYQPWNELVEITTGVTTNVNPIYVPKIVTPKQLAKDAEARAQGVMLSYMLPTAENPLMMKGGCAKVYTDYDRIIAVGTTTATCTAPAYLCQDRVCNPTIIFSSSEPLSSVIGFPGRDDVLVVSGGARSFVLELDPRTPEFFAPLVHAKGAKAAPWTEHSILVTTDQGIREVEL
jgi:hypothetical protein